MNVHLDAAEFASIRGSHTYSHVNEPDEGDSAVPYPPFKSLESAQAYAGLRPNAANVNSCRAIAMVGMRRGRFPAPSARSLPFKETIVYSAVCLNVHAIVQAGIYYPPRLVMEDIEFQHSCHNAGLAIVKCMGLVHFKANFTPKATDASGSEAGTSDAPYVWNANTHLSFDDACKNHAMGPAPSLDAALLELSGQCRPVVIQREQERLNQVEDPISKALFRSGATCLPVTMIPAGTPPLRNLAQGDSVGFVWLCAMNLPALDCIATACKEASLPAGCKVVILLPLGRVRFNRKHLASLSQLRSHLESSQFQWSVKNVGDVALVVDFVRSSPALLSADDKLHHCPNRNSSEFILIVCKVAPPAPKAASPAPIKKKKADPLPIDSAAQNLVTPKKKKKKTPTAKTPALVTSAKKQKADVDTPAPPAVPPAAAQPKQEFPAAKKVVAFGDSVLPKQFDAPLEISSISLHNFDKKQAHAPFQLEINFLKKRPETYSFDLRVAWATATDSVNLATLDVSPPVGVGRLEPVPVDVDDDGLLSQAAATAKPPFGEQKDSRIVATLHLNSVELLRATFKVSVNKHGTRFDHGSSAQIERSAAVTPPAAADNAEQTVTTPVLKMSMKRSSIEDAAPPPKQARSEKPTGPTTSASTPSAPAAGQFS